MMLHFASSYRVKKSMRYVVLASFLGVCGLIRAEALEANRSGAVGVPQDFELVELWQVGASEDDEVLFGRLWDVAVDSKGISYAVGPSHPAVYAFSGTGTLVAEIGRGGEGPGEFKGIHDVFVGVGDTVFVWDFDGRRVTSFSPDGYGFVERVRVNNAPVSAYPSDLIGVTSEVFIFKYEHLLKDGVDNQATRGVKVHLVDRRRGVILEQPPMVKMSDPGLVVDDGSDGSISMRRMPFRGMPEFYASQKGFLYAAHGDASAITVMSTDGAVQDTIRWTHDPVPVTRREAEETLEKLSRRTRKVLRQKGIGIPKSKAAFTNLVVDEQDRVWIQLSAAYGESLATCLILSADGNKVDSVKLPVTLRLEAIRGNRAHGIMTVDNGANVLVAYAIQGGD